MTAPFKSGPREPDLIQTHANNQQSDGTQRRRGVKKKFGETSKSLRQLDYFLVRFCFLLFFFSLILLFGFRLWGGKNIYDNLRLRGGRIAGSGLLIWLGAIESIWFGWPALLGWLL